MAGSLNKVLLIGEFMDMAIEIATFYFERYVFVMWGN